MTSALIAALEVSRSTVTMPTGKTAYFIPREKGYRVLDARDYCAMIHQLEKRARRERRRPASWRAA